MVQHSGAFEWFGHVQGVASPRTTAERLSVPKEYPGAIWDWAGGGALVHHRVALIRMYR